MYNSLTKYGLSFLFLFSFLVANSQTVLPVNRYVYTPKSDVQIEHPVAPTIGFSLRRISALYKGAGIKIRRNNDNAEADVYFNNDDVIGTTSEVIVTNIGSSALSLNDTLTYSSFVGTSTAFVNTWYHQASDPSFNAIQTNHNSQPFVELNTIGASNNLPSLRFAGNDFLTIFKPVEDILENSINGSFLVVLKTVQNKSHFTFGVRTSTNWRWAFHINWSNGLIYFDSGEICCQHPRSSGNNLNVWKQYSFIRGNLRKLARINGVNSSINSTNSPSIPRTGTASPDGFQIGKAVGDTRCFNGSMSEVLMYPKELLSSEYLGVEQNQTAYWNL